MVGPLDSRTSLEEATKELQLLESLIPSDSMGFGQRDWMEEGSRMDCREPLLQGPEDRDSPNDPWMEANRPTKWRRPESKGSADQGKGPSRLQPEPTYDSSWDNWEQWPTRRTDARGENQLRELQSLRHRMDLLTTLVLRHDNQLNISAQDTSFMIFVRTDMEANLGAIMHEAAKTWNSIKASTPEKLTSPMRIILIQKLLVTVLARFNKVMEKEDTMNKAKKMGWLTEDGLRLNAMKWDPVKKCHVVNDQLPAITCAEAKEALTEMAVLSATQRSVNRFHATRQMAEEYSSPTMSFMLDVGLRTTEANKMWKLLTELSHSAVWVMSGAYLRHARLQRDQLAQRVAQAKGGRKGKGKSKQGKGNGSGGKTWS